MMRRGWQKAQPPPPRARCHNNNRVRRCFSGARAVVDDSSPLFVIANAFFSAAAPASVIDLLAVSRPRQTDWERKTNVEGEKHGQGGESGPRGSIPG